MLEKAFSQYGVAGVCILLTIMVLMRAGEFVWAITAEKEKEKQTISSKAIEDLTKALKESTIAIGTLEHRLEHIERVVLEFPKLKNDVRRFYSAIKQVSGDRWPQIRDEIMKDDFTL